MHLQFNITVDTPVSIGRIKMNAAHCSSNNNWLIFLSRTVLIEFSQLTSQTSMAADESDIHLVHPVIDVETLNLSSQSASNNQYRN